MPEWYRAYERPIFDLATDRVDGPADREAAANHRAAAAAAARGGTPVITPARRRKPTPVHADIRAMLEAEANRRLARKREARLGEIARALGRSATDGGRGITASRRRTRSGGA